MEYNKRQFAKANDKKVLHKVKKHWVVMSMALLMAIGGEAAVTHVSAHAESNNSNPQTSNSNTLKERINQNLIQAYKAQSTQNQLSRGSQGQTAQKQTVNPQQSTSNGRINRQASLNSISKQADVLHQRILRNADWSSSFNVQAAPRNEVKSTPRIMYPSTPVVGKTINGVPGFHSDIPMPDEADTNAFNHVGSDHSASNPAGEHIYSNDNYNNMAIDGYNVSDGDQIATYNPQNYNKFTRLNQQRSYGPRTLPANWGPRETSRKIANGTWSYEEAGEGNPGYTASGSKYSDDGYDQANWTLYSDGLLYVSDGVIGNDTGDDGEINEVISNYANKITTIQTNNITFSNDPFYWASDLPNLNHANMAGTDLSPAKMYTGSGGGNIFRNCGSLASITINNQESFVSDNSNGVHLFDSDSWYGPGPNGPSVQIDDSMNHNDQGINPVTHKAYPRDQTYYNSQNCSKATVRYIYNYDYSSPSDTIHSDSIRSKIIVMNEPSPGWYDKSIQTSQFTNPFLSNGYTINTAWASKHPTVSIDGLKSEDESKYGTSDVIIPLVKMAPVTYWFGNQKVGVGAAPFSKDGIQSDTASDLEINGMPQGYGIDPREATTVRVSSTGPNNIQVDCTGNWQTNNGQGTAKWYLTPNTDNDVTRRFGKNSMYVTAGVNGNTLGNNGASEPYGLDGIPSITQHQFADRDSSGNIIKDSHGHVQYHSVNLEPDIDNISFSDVQAPSDSRSLFWGTNLKNLSRINLNYTGRPGDGLNTSDVSDMAYMFHASHSDTLKEIDNLSDLSTVNVNHNGNGSLEGMFLNTAIPNDMGGDPHSKTGMEKWNVRGTHNVKDMFSGDKAFSDWSDIQNNWQFQTGNPDEGPSDTNMFGNTPFNDGEKGTYRQSPQMWYHTSDGGVWMFTPDKMPNKFTYYDWFTGEPVGDEDTCQVKPGHSLHYNVAYITTHPDGYTLASNGDDGAPSGISELVGGSNNYVPDIKVKIASDRQYGIPVVSNDVVDYGYDGTAKYELTKDGTLTFSGDALEGQPVLKVGSIGNLLNNNVLSHSNEAGRVKKIKFENVQAPSNSSNLFSNLPNVKDIDVNNLITYNVNNMAHMFDANGNHTLIHIDHLSDLDTSDVSNMQGMFENAGISDLRGVSDWNVYGVTNLDSDFANDVNLKKWNEVYDHWAFNNPKPAFSDTNMLSGDNQLTVASGVTEPTPATHKRQDDEDPAINDKYMFVPNQIGHETNYYSWQTGEAISGQEISHLTPDKSIRYDDLNNHEVAVLPNYKLADHGDNNDPSTGSSDYLPYFNVSQNSDDIYTVPAVKSDVTNYGFDGTSKYTLDKQGNLFFYGGQLNSGDVSTVLNKANEAGQIKNVTFENVTAPTDMTNLFSGLSNLNTIDFAGLNTQKVTKMGSLLASDPNLSDAEVSTLDTHNVSDMNSMFKGDPKLIGLDVSKFDTANLSDMRNLFKGDRELSDLDLKNFNTAVPLSKNQISDVFTGDSNLNRLTLSNQTVFTNNVGLDYAWLPSTDANYNDIENLENDEHHPGIWNAVMNKSGVWGTAAWALVDNGNLYLANGDLQTNKWPSWLAKTDVQKKVHTNQVKSPQDASDLFGGLTNMQQFDGSGLDVSHVTSMKNMFASDPSIHNLNLSSFNPSALSSMGGMFANDSNLNHLDVSQLQFSDKSGDSFSGDNALLELKLGSQLKLTDPNNSADAKFFAHNVDGNDYITTHAIATGTQSAGTYFTASPVSIRFVNQNENSDEPDSLNGKYVYVPTDSDSYQFGYHGNVHDQLAALHLTHTTDPNDQADPHHTILPAAQQDYEIHNALNNNPYVNVRVSGNAVMNKNDNQARIVYENSDENSEVGPNEPNPQTVTVTLSGNDSDYIDYDPRNLVPKGYQLDTDHTVNSDFRAQITSGNQFNWVHPNLESGIPTVYVKGDHETAYAKVHQIIETPKGRVIGSDYKAVSDQASVGQEYKLHNSDKPVSAPDADVPIPSDCVLAGTSGYNVPDASKNNDLTGLMLLNDSGQAYLEHPNETVYYVDTKTHSNITVCYINQQGNEVGHFPVTQSDDSSLDLSSNSNFVKNHVVPGYSYDSNSPYNYIYKETPVYFDGNTQDAYVHVLGQEETLDIQYKTYKKGNLVSEPKIKNNDTRVGNRLSDALSGILPKHYVITDKDPNGHNQVTNYEIPYISGDNPTAGPYTLYVTGQIKTVPVKFSDQNHNNPLGNLDDSTKGKIYSDVTLPNAPKYYHYASGQSNQDHLKLSDVDTSYNPNGTNPNSDNYMNVVPVRIEGDQAKVHVKYMDQNGNQVGSDMITSNDSGRPTEMGDTVTCYPDGKSANGSAPAGYTINNASDQNYTFKPSDVASTGNPLNMKDYVIHVHGNSEQMQPQINVVYENGDKNHTPQSSHLVTLHVNSDDGDKYVFYPSEMLNSTGYPNIPSGYSLDTSANKTPNSYTADLSANHLTWENPSTHQLQNGYRPTVYFVAQRSNQLSNVSDTIHITQVETDPNGHVIGTTEKSDTLSDYCHGNKYVGNRYQIPESSIATPQNWQLAEGDDPNAVLNQDSNHQYNIDGHVDANGITNNHVTLYYVARHDSNPLTIHYKIKGHDSDVTKHTYSSGYYGQQINGFDQFDATPLDNYKLDVQNTPVNTEFTFGVNDDNLIAPNENTVYVLPANVSNNSVTVHVDLEDKNGNQIPGKSDISVPVAVYPNQDGSFKISSDNDVLKAKTQGFLPNHADEGFGANNVNSDIVGNLEADGPSLTKNKGAKFFYHANENDAGSITVKYRNQDGRYVTLNGSDVSDYLYPGYKIYNHAGRSDYYYGQTINVKNTVGVPRGYHYSNGPVNYTFNGSDQTALINLQGNTASQLPVTIKVIRRDPNMNVQQPAPYYTINGTISGNVGDQFNFSPLDYTPKGYNTSLDGLATLKVNWDAVHNKPVLSNNGTVIFNYLETPSDTNTNDLKPVDVNYVNVRTHQVIKHGDITSTNLPTAYDGLVIPNVTKYVSMPKGYSAYNDTFNPNTSDNTQAIMNDKPSTVSLLVQPTNSTGHDPSNTDGYDSDGASDNAEPIYINYIYADQVIGAKNRRVDGDLGQTIDVADQSNCAVPAGYHITFGQHLDYKIGTRSQTHNIMLRPNTCSDATYQVTVRLVSPSYQLIQSDQVPYRVKLSGSKVIDVNNPSDPNVNVGNLISNHDYQFDSTLSSISTSTRIYNNGGRITNRGGVDMGPTLLTYIAQKDPANSGKITVHYIDDDTGQELSQTKSGSYVITRGHGDYDDEKFSASDIAKDTVDGVAVPNGYSMDANQNQTYTMGINGSNTQANIYVHGNLKQANQPINIHIYDPFGKHVLQSYTVSDSIKGAVGSSFNVKASDFLPSHSDVPFIPSGIISNNQATGQITSSGINMNPSTVNFYYKMPNVDENVANVKPIYVIYTDNGQQVGSDQEIKPISGTDYQGEIVSDVTKRSASQRGTTWSTLQSKGYQITPGSQLKNDSNLNQTGNQDLSATFNTSHSPYVTVNIEKHPNQDTGNLLVVQNLYNHNGSDLMSTRTKSEKVGPGTVGQKVMIHAHDYDRLVPGYKLVDPSADSNETKSLISDTYTLNGLSNGVVVYDYQATNSTGHNSDDSNHAEPIFVRYYDGSTSNPSNQIKYSGYTGRIDGDMGQTFDITQQPGTEIPYGYQLASSYNLSRTIDGQPQVVDLEVEPVSKNSKRFNITKVFYDTSDNHIINTPSVHTETEAVYLTNSQTLTAAGENSDASDFVSDTSRNSNVPVTVSGSGINPSGCTFYYKALAHGADVAPITVNYYNQHNQPISLNNKITSGAMGQTINVANATDNNVINAGYSVINNQKLNYSLSKTPQTVNLVVDGNPDHPTNASDQMKIKIVKEDINGNPLPNPYDKTVSINGRIGDKYTLEASAFAPNNYVVDHKYMTQVNGSINNNGITKPGTEPVFRYIPQVAAAPIHIDCYNQSGAKLFSDISTNGLYGDQVNVYNYVANHDADKLKGYEKPADLNDYNYVYNNHEQYATVVVTGKLINNIPYQVNRIKNYQVDEHISDTFTGNLTARVGDVRTISPSDCIPSGYYVDSKDQPIKITINSDGQVVPSSKLQFTYDHQDVTAHVLYKDVSDNDDQVGEEDITDRPGTPINYDDYQYFLPYGYQFNRFGNKLPYLMQGGSITVYVDSLNDPIAPTPKVRNNYGWINVKYVYHDNVIANRAITNKIGNSFNVHNYSSSDSVFNNYDFMASTSAPVGYKIDSNTNMVNQFKDTPQTLTINVEPQRSSVNSDVADLIVYKDVDTGQVLTHRRVLVGHPGSKINYQPYEEFLPSGASYDGLGSHEDTLEGNYTDVILVRPATDDYQYGTISINYYDVSHGGKRFILSDMEVNRDRTLFNLNDYNKFMPNGYNFDHVISGSTHMFNNGHQTLNIGVVPTGGQFSTVTIEYRDASDKIVREPSGKPIAQQVTGKIGNAFDWTSYLDYVPNGYAYRSVQSNIPMKFGHNDTTVYIYVKKI